jgi:ribosomal protein S18
LNEIGGRVYNKFNPIDRSSVEKFDYKDKYIMLTYVVENNQYSKVFIN